MIRRFCLCAAFAIAILASSLPARAALTSINPSSDDGSGKTLADIMNDLYGAGKYVQINDNADQIWAFTAASATLSAQVRYAGDLSSLGFFSPGAIANAANYTRIADITLGVAGDGFSAQFSNPSSYGDISGDVLTIRTSGSPPPTDAMPSPFAWGFSDTRNNGINSDDLYWSSEMGKNNDPGSNPGSFGQVNTTDHMVTFFVTNSAGSGPHAVNGFTGYVIAYEDRSHALKSDRDFNDAVIQINGGVVPTPEPSTLAIAGLGGLGLIGYGLRRRRGA